MVNNVQRIVGSTIQPPNRFYGSSAYQPTIAPPLLRESLPPPTQNQYYIPGRQGDVYSSTGSSTLKRRRPPFIPSTADGVFYPTVTSITPSELPAPFGSTTRPQDDSGFSSTTRPYPVPNNNFGPTSLPYPVQTGFTIGPSNDPFDLRNGLIVSSTPSPPPGLYSGPNNFGDIPVPYGPQPNPYQSSNQQIPTDDGSSSYGGNDDTVYITPPPKTYLGPSSVPQQYQPQQQQQQQSLYPTRPYLPRHVLPPYINEVDSSYFHSINQFQPFAQNGLLGQPQPQQQQQQQQQFQYPIDQQYYPVTDYGPHHRFFNKK